MQSSDGYILRARPFSDASVIVDLFTKDVGCLTCITRPAKLRGKVQKGHLQAFQLLQLHWQGRSEMPRLAQSNERHRHRIPPDKLLYGLYLNELLLKLIQPHVAMSTLFSTYQHSLELLCDSEMPMVVVIRFELALLQELGHMPDLWYEDYGGSPIDSSQSYVYEINSGLQAANASVLPHAVLISGGLLIAMRQLESMELPHYHELRQFLDALLQKLVRKPFNSRKLLHFK